MNDASKYPVKYGFGLTTPPTWSKTHPHLGVDRPTPVGTPLVVNGQTIALTGNTGGVVAHLHIQKVKDGTVVNPGNEGFTLPEPARIFKTGDSPKIGKYIRIKDAQGVEWSYFHLSVIKVKPGDTIGENMTRRRLTPQECVDRFKNFAGRNDIKLTDPVCQNRYEDPESDEFLYNLLIHVRDLRIAAETRERQATEKLKEYQKYDKFIESFKEITK